MTNIGWIVMGAVALANCCVLIFGNGMWLKTVRAGRVDKYVPLWKQARKEKNDKVSALKAYVVRGDSMRDYDIHDGNVVYVRPFAKEEKGAIQTHPVLMFSIVGMPYIGSRYKLRKFVSYVNLQTEKWEDVYKTNKDRIKIDEDQFVEMCKDKAEKESKRCGVSVGTSQYILSETHEATFRYSLHPVDSLFGKVCYVSGGKE